MKFFELDVGGLDLRSELDAAYSRVLASGQLILGPELEAFEAERKGPNGIVEMSREKRAALAEKTKALKA